MLTLTKSISYHNNSEVLYSICKEADRKFKVNLLVMLQAV